MSQDTSTDTEKDSYDQYEAKLDELKASLRESYAAGFAQAIETFDVEACTDVSELKENPALGESHYYYWEGRQIPLEPWLRQQFGIDTDLGGDDGE